MSQPALTMTKLHPLVSKLPGNCLKSMVFNSFRKQFATDNVDLYDTIGQIIDGNQHIPVSDRIDMEEALALYRYFAFGTYSPIGRGGTLYDCILRGACSP